jgi:hypothetical protein
MSGQRRTRRPPRSKPRGVTFRPRAHTTMQMSRAPPGEQRRDEPPQSSKQRGRDRERAPPGEQREEDPGRLADHRHRGVERTLLPCRGEIDREHAPGFGSRLEQGEQEALSGELLVQQPELVEPRTPRRR